MKEPPLQLCDLNPVSVIGYGKYSTVVHADTRRSTYAVKIIPKTNNDEQLSKIAPLSAVHTTPDYNTEIHILRRITPYCHENIIQTAAIFVSLTTVYIVQELSIQGDLTPTYFRSNNKALVDILSAIHFLHSLNIVHRDIKPANFLIFPDAIKLTDFDTCYTLTNNDKQDNAALYMKPVGTPMFLPPELIQLDFDSTTSNSTFSTLKRKLKTFHRPTHHPFALDMWSLGVTLYYLVYSSYPFNANNEFALQHEITTKSPNFPNHPLSTTIKSLLVKDAASRFTMTQLINSLHIKIPSLPQSIGSPPTITNVGNTDLPAVELNNSPHQLRIDLPIFDSTEQLPSPSSGSLKHSEKMNFRKFQRENSIKSNYNSVNDYLDNL